MTPGSTFASGTRTLSKNKADVIEALRENLFLISWAVKPGMSFSTMNPRTPSLDIAHTMAASAILPFFNISPFLNWGTAFLMSAVVYYFILSVSLAIGMLPFLFAVAALASWLSLSQYPLIWLSAGLAGGAVIGLWLGHYAKGGVRAVLQDIQLMMIAPFWLLSVLYRRLGIPY